MKLTKVSLVLLALLLFGLPSAPANAWTYGQDYTENVSNLPIATSSGAASRLVVYSVPVEAQAGEVALFSCMYEVTNPYSYNVMLGRFITLADSPTSVVMTGPGVLPVRGAGDNVTPAQHHGVANLHGIFYFSEAWTGYANCVGYAAASSASSGHKLAVEQGYGKMDVLVIPATP